LVNNLLLARLINQLHGGAVVAAWEIDTLDEPTLDVFRLWRDELPRMQSAFAEIKAIQDKIRREVLG
jgi:hypothetical protein